MGAHPRVCGENLTSRLKACSVLGSSPRVRGKRIHGESLHLVTGLIPACAGKTLSARNSCRPFRAHPRVCGENPIPDPGQISLAGSSPRVRGKLSVWGMWFFCMAAHPRVCGENFFTQLIDTRKNGSSPRVRGKPWPPGVVINLSRLIPACAGKTAFQDYLPCTGPAHPRVCGENCGQSLRLRTRGGSSPRVRGKRWFRNSGQPSGRLIPACAGKTTHDRHDHPRTGAHPRVCGENSICSCPVIPANGSSPRVRGKRTSGPRRRGWRGLIPACAGKTLRARNSCRPFRAHPRVCGENLCDGATYPVVQGSSPRVRGKPARPARSRRARGLIPACAGKTPGVWRRPPGGGAHPRVCGENRL